MKAFILLFLIIGIVMLALGYQRSILQTTEVKTIIEYRFVPRNLYDDQFSPAKLESTYSDMFDKQDLFFRKS